MCEKWKDFSHTKACSQCKEEKPRTPEYFNRHKNAKDGLKPTCKECIKIYREKTIDAQRIRQARYVEKNQELVKERQKQYTAANKEKKKEYDKRYNEENKERIAKRRKEYYDKNFEKIQEYNKERNKDPEFKKARRAYRESRKQRDKFLYAQWRKENSERVSTIKQRRYNKQKNVECTLTHNQWLEILECFNNSCCYCGENSTMTRDHFVPVSEGGGFTLENILPACRSCNSSKGNRDFFDWYPHYVCYSDEREFAILEHLGFLEKNCEYDEL